MFYFQLYYFLARNGETKDLPATDRRGFHLTRPWGYARAPFRFAFREIHVSFAFPLLGRGLALLPRGLGVAEPSVAEPHGELAPWDASQL